ncbi:MAG: ADP-ribosylglycohydrolase family protein [Bacteroidota bacterium]
MSSRFSASFFTLVCICTFLSVFAPFTGNAGLNAGKKKLTLIEYNNKVTGAFTGKLGGTALGLAAAAGLENGILPDSKSPKMNAQTLNFSLYSPEFYAAFVFLGAQSKYGFGCSPKDYGKGLTAKDLQVPAAGMHALFAARLNLLAGIEPPFSGMLAFNSHSTDFDAAVCTDYMGLVCPGMPSQAAVMAVQASAAMASEEGKLASGFVAAMVSKAMVTDSINDVIEAGIAVLPNNSEFEKMCNYALKLSRKYPGRYATIRDTLNKRFSHRALCPLSEIHKMAAGHDAAISSALLVAALHSGHGDYFRTIAIAIRTGDNPVQIASAAGSILGALTGNRKLPKMLLLNVNINRLAGDQQFSIKAAADTCQSLMRMALNNFGGTLVFTKQKNANQLPDKDPEISFPSQPMRRLITEPLLINSAVQPQISYKVSGQKLRLKTGKSLKGSHIEWYFSDGSIASGKKIKHKFRLPGRYSARSIISGKNENYSKVLEFEIQPGNKQQDNSGIESLPVKTIDEVTGIQAINKYKDNKNSYNWITELGEKMYPGNVFRPEALVPGRHVLMLDEEPVNGKESIATAINVYSPALINNNKYPFVYRANDKSYPWEGLSFNMLSQNIRGNISGVGDLSAGFKWSVQDSVLNFIVKVTDGFVGPFGKKQYDPEYETDTIPGVAGYEGLDMFFYTRDSSGLGINPLNLLPVIKRSNALSENEKPVINKLIHLNIRLQNLKASYNNAPEQEMKDCSQRVKVYSAGKGAVKFYEFGVPLAMFGLKQASRRNFGFNMLFTDRDGGPPKTIAWSFCHGFPAFDPNELGLASFDSGK